MLTKYKGKVIPVSIYVAGHNKVDNRRTFCKASECEATGIEVDCDDCLFDDYDNSNLALFREWKAEL